MKGISTISCGNQTVRQNTAKNTKKSATKNNRHKDYFEVQQVIIIVFDLQGTKIITNRYRTLKDTINRCSSTYINYIYIYIYNVNGYLEYTRYNRNMCRYRTHVRTENLRTAKMYVELYTAEITRTI